MLSYKIINTIARYELKCLYRTWFFKIFAIIALLGLGFFHILTSTDTSLNEWAFHALPANVPYTNIKFLNIIQSIIAIFLASGFLKKDKQLDTSVVIYVRPMSNAEYVFGKTLGVFKLFMGLNFLSLAFAYAMSIVATGSLPDVIPFFVYPLLISVPSLIFIFGLSFVTMSFVKNQSITFLLLLGYVVTCVFYLGSKIDSIYDYTSFHLAMLYSDIVGFSNLEEVLLHRGAYLLIGLGFIFLTIIKIDRLPNAAYKIKRYLIVTSILFIAGIACLSKICINNANISDKKASFAILNNEYYNKPSVDIYKTDISLIHQEKRISCQANLSIRNKTKENLKTYIISLNPGLIIESIETNNKSLKYSRKENIIEITDNIAIGEEKIINLKYSGNIDESVCYTDIPDKTFKEKISYFALNIPKKYSFLESNYVLLTPETNWYPTSGLSYNPLKPSIGRYRFSRYSLNVKTKKGLTALSQGEMTLEKDGTFSFKSEAPLSQISLLIGQYEKQELEVDGITYSIHFKKGHDYYTSTFESLKDTLPSLIRSMMSDYELKQNRDYPYQRISLVEAPAQFFSYKRLWTNHQETVQPEMVFLPELGLTLPDADFARSFKYSKERRQRDDATVKENDLKSEIFNRNIYEIFFADENKNETDFDLGMNLFAGTDIDTKVYSLYPNFYTFTNNIYSKDYPVVGGIIENLTKDETQARGVWWMTMLGGITSQEKANLVLSKNKFEDILKHSTDYEDLLNDIMQNKADFFKAILNNKIDKKQLRKSLTYFYDMNMYKNIDIKELLDYLNEEYNIEIYSQLDQWYHSSTIPGYKIENIEAYTVKDGEDVKYQIKIHISNLEAVDGFVNFKISLSNGGGRRESRAKRQSAALDYSFSLKGKTAYEIGIVTTTKPVVITANTIISKNIPAKMTKRFENFEESNAIAFDGIREVSMEESKDVIIVDNEDKEFQLVQDIKEKKLKQYLSSINKEDKDKYKSMNPWNPPSRWTLFTKEGQYGKYIRSAYYARANENNKKAIWTADIKKAGYYEVSFFYNTEVWNSRRRGNKENASSTYYLNVSSDEGDSNIEVNLEGDNDKGWFSLGSYYFSKGKAKVELLDKTSSRIIVADAVKWLKKE